MSLLDALEDYREAWKAFDLVRGGLTSSDVCRAYDELPPGLVRAARDLIDACRVLKFWYHTVDGTTAVIYSPAVQSEYLESDLSRRYAELYVDPRTYR